MHMGLTRTFVGRSTWTVVVALALVTACSGGDDSTAESTAPTTPATAPGTTASTEPAPATTTETTTTDTTTTDPTNSIETTTGPTTTAGDQPAPGDWAPLDPASGSWLAFTSGRTGQGELWAIEVDSGTERQLTEGIGEARQPAWSPDGSSIAFVCPNTGPETGVESGVGGDDICLLDLTSGDVAYLTDDAAGDQGPTWSPDSARLAFIKFGEDGVVRVQSLDVAAGGEPVEVAEGSGPEWSPDGSILAVVGPDGELLMVDQATGERRVLVESGYQFSSLAWSPDGTEIAYVCAAGEQGPDDFAPATDICVIATDGSAQRAIEYGGPNDSGPAWSPDGTAIVFTSTDYSMGTSEVVVALASGAPRAITSGTSPAWSPDGRQIALVAPDGGIQLIDGESGETSDISIDPTAGDLAWAPAG
jgi:Tol biopolymer transport system component